MTNQSHFEQCLSFITTQLQPGHGRLIPDGVPRRAVTISRQAGCGASVIAEKLVEYFQTHVKSESGSWAIFDRNLVEKVLEEHHLPQRLWKFMPEDRLPAIDDTIDELFGLHPPSWILVRRTAETILHLAKLGNVILIGRGANVITSKLPHVFHVRLVGSLETRARHIQETNCLDQESALEFIRREDIGRKRYLRKYFHRDLADPLLYHLVINTDIVPYDEAAKIIGEAVINRSPAHPKSVAA